MTRETKYKYDIALVLPTFNEKDNILIIIERIQKALKGKSFQIVVVDDNSPDLTWEIAQKTARKHNNVQVVRRLHESGLSSAIIEGFSIADSRYMVVMDADLQHDEKILPRFLKGFMEDNYDIIIGSRKTDGGEIAEWSFIRRFISWVATQMAHFILKNNVTDPMSGFFGVSKSILETSTGKINPRGFKLLLEILAHNPGVQILEIGYSFQKRIHGKSKLNTNVIVDYLIALYELSLGKYIPLRFIRFSIIGVSGLVVNQAGVWAGMNLLNLTEYYSLVVGIELSLISNYFLNNFWTFHDYRHKGLKMISGVILYHIISLTGAVINYSTAILFINRFQLNIYISNFIGVMISAVWNYRINFQVTWKKEL
jgi:dolichol-phosphate mannosyltransferase